MALLSAVSHDLKTPLASIKGAVTSLLLRDGAWPPEEHDELLKTIDTEADRLNHLVGNLLDVSRIEAGALRPLVDWYTVQDVIEMALAQSSYVIGKRTINICVDPGAPLVRLDLVLVAQVLSNLLENGVRHAKTELPLDIKVAVADKLLRIEVADHGVGVPPEETERIFDRFARSRTRDEREGVGLGLAISRGIAEAHGGRISVRNTEGGGATFVLSLPQPDRMEGVRIPDVPALAPA